MGDMVENGYVQPRILTIFAGGTVCTDVSDIGARAGLLGKSCRSLAIWLSEIKHYQPDSRLILNLNLNLFGLF